MTSPHYLFLCLNIWMMSTRKHFRKFQINTYVCLCILLFSISTFAFVAAEKDLLTDFDGLEKTLNHVENHLSTQAELRKSIKESLLELGLCEPTEKLITLIPKSILTYHYVQFRMTLRK